MKMSSLFLYLIGECIVVAKDFVQVLAFYSIIFCEPFIRPRDVNTWNEFVIKDV